jgi:hypothetical protein
MSDLTILESKDFREEMIKRSAWCDHIIGEYGWQSMREILQTAFALKQEYDEKMKGDTA